MCWRINPTCASNLPEGKIAEICVAFGQCRQLYEAEKVHSILGKPYTARVARPSVASIYAVGNAVSAAWTQPAKNTHVVIILLCSCDN